MEAFLVSLSAVAVAEVGDRTQLLSLMLVCCYRKPWVILGGIVASTIVNHLFAGVVGILLASWLTPRVLDAIVAVSLMGMAGWTLVPDKEGAKPDCSSRNVFFTTLTMFFLAEMGDKTQIATTALAAAYHNLWLVVAGSTLGLLLANAPVLFLGNAFATRLPLKTIRVVAALIFAVLAVLFAVRAITG
ncbi:putative Ca2+/H+ antiporter (TMEM165/GDT1 family) [Rhizomicrobium palustre]|uniref:GDT1 family protein n=1 Tax=Rhizomicrobium palustre TaxID=189966 RepID=A0A846MWQ3_9PROT|nr:TMEM165/GDT1 family protein [Rhizomicrobium palustre]NIK87655.1 putative Ca2+/H+ antiporter (TMEM165/GDT1 family) [Rhizomicrobium palustre]